MTYEEFKNTLTIALKEELGTDGKISLGTDIIMGRSADTITVTILSSGKTFSSGTESLYTLSQKSGMDTRAVAALLLQSASDVMHNQEINPSNIVYRLVNAADNKEMLQTTPHIPFYDMAILFVCILHDNDRQRSFLFITKDLMEKQHFTLQQLCDLASQNTFRLFPSHAEPLPLYMLRAAMRNDSATLEDYLDVAFAAYAGKDKPPMLHVCTPDYRYGAVAMLDTAFLDEMAQDFNSDLYLLPCSTEDFLILPLQGSDEKLPLQKFADEVLAADKTAVLTEYVFRYSRKSKKLELIK